MALGHGWAPLRINQTIIIITRLLMGAEITVTQCQNWVLGSEIKAVRDFGLGAEEER